MAGNPLIEVLCFEQCESAEPSFRLVREIARGIAPTAEVRRVEVETEESASLLGFLGSPTVRVDGVDIEGREGPSPGLACRLYFGSGGTPPRWMIEAAILRALRPRSILFLCVANSARSQMAEGIARHLAPTGVDVFSAGSRPTQMNPYAVGVLAEIGIDISAQRSKPLCEVPADRVDAVITLCAEEACPVFPGSGSRLHWELPDPAAFPGGNFERLLAFRSTRDEILRRLKLLFRA